MTQGSASDSAKQSSATDDALLQREIDDALGGQSVEQIMADADSAAEDPPAPQEASREAHTEFHTEMRRGRIAAIRGEDVFVNLPGEDSRLQGVVPLAQFDRAPRLGSIMDFVVDHVDEKQGLIYLSREGAVSRATWEQLQRGAIVDARVIGTNKGGLDLEMVGGIRAFMPASLIDLHHVNQLESFIGQKLEGMVQEIDRKSKKVVLSRRHVLEHRREQAKATLLTKLEVGNVVEGKVSNVVDFGAFVDLGGVDGLVHVSDLSYEHVKHPKDVVKTGDSIKVKVLKIDPENDRISLGLKQVAPDPWENITDKYPTGRQCEARVTRLAKFGAFIELEAGIEGLLPISEMSWSRVGQAQDVVKQGDTVRVAVIGVDPKRHRISLSLKQVQGDPWMGAERKYEKDSQHEGKVISVTDFGAFVELEPGVEGLVHISELADHHVKTVDSVVKVGDTRSFRVLEVDEDQHKVRLSLKDPNAAPQQPHDHGHGGERRRGRKQPAAPRTATSRAHRKDLKSGLGDVGSMGLGDLRLDDLK